MVITTNYLSLKATAEFSLKLFLFSLLAYYVIKFIYKNMKFWPIPSVLYLVFSLMIIIPATSVNIDFLSGGLGMLAAYSVNWPGNLLAIGLYKHGQDSMENMRVLVWFNCFLGFVQYLILGIIFEAAGKKVIGIIKKEKDT